MYTHKVLLKLIQFVKLHYQNYKFSSIKFSIIKLSSKVQTIKNSVFHEMENVILPQKFPSIGDNYFTPSYRTSKKGEVEMSEKCVDRIMHDVCTRFVRSNELQRVYST